MDKLTITDIKILDTVACLNEHGFYPIQDGVYKVLKGIVDSETIEFVYYPTFSTLISCKAKKISMMIMMLIRYRYLERVFDKSSEELCLKITELGKRELADFHKKHKVNYIKKTKRIKKCFFRI